MLRLIKATYSNQTVKIFSSFERITDHSDITEIDCHSNELTSLPDNMNFPNLQEFYCYNNQLTRLPDNMNFPNLQRFYCKNNQFTSLSDNMNFPNLQEFDCSDNQLTRLPDNMNFPNLQKFYCSYNQLSSLPDNIISWRNLIIIDTSGNELEFTTRQIRFLNNIRNTSQRLEVYSDPQNVHNSNIQSCVKESIARLISSVNMREYHKDKLTQRILSDSLILNKESLIEYSDHNEVHSLLDVTLGEVLWTVFETTNTFDQETQREIKNIFNQDMKDAECKCTTGIFNRTINCLNGFTDLVHINIKDSEQISNLIFLIKEKLGDNYSIEEHKRLVKNEMKERDYSEDEISTWIEYIE